MEMLVLCYGVSARDEQILPAEELLEAAGSENSYAAPARFTGQHLAVLPW